jgi:hypothetical protein
LHDDREVLSIIDVFEQSSLGATGMINAGTLGGVLFLHWSARTCHTLAPGTVAFAGTEAHVCVVYKRLERFTPGCTEPEWMTIITVLCRSLSKFFLLRQLEETQQHFFANVP